MENTHYKMLERKIDELISLCNELKRENGELKAKENSWAREKKSLLEKTELAKTRVENMITRLKALEQES